jgi:flagellar motor switch protein FliM
LFRKAAKSGYGLNVEVAEVEVSRIRTEVALENLPDIAVRLMLSTADGDLGLCVINGELNDGLIEQQTLGRIAKAARGDRAVTEIDAALCEGFVRTVLSIMETELAATPQASAVLGYVCDKPNFDLEDLTLMLVAEHMDVMRVSIDLGPGVKTGKIEFWFPANGVVTSADGVVSNPVGPKLRNHVLDVEVNVNAMLDPVPISLGKMLDLKVGDLLEIPREALVSARIMDQRGVLVTRARLGQLNGRRAARITSFKPKSSVLDTTDPTMGSMDEGMIAANPLPQDMPSFDDASSPELPVAGIDMPAMASPDLDMPTMATPEFDMPEMGVAMDFDPEANS